MGVSHDITGVRKVFYNRVFGFEIEFVSNKITYTHLSHTSFINTHFCFILEYPRTFLANSIPGYFNLFL